MRPAACRHGLRVLAASLLASILLGCAGGEPPRLGARDLEDLEPAQLMRLGNQFRNAGDPSTALRLYMQAAERMPESPEPPVAMGDLQLENGRIEPAKDAYNQALARSAGYVPALAGLAQAEIAAGRPEAALLALDELEAQEPQGDESVLLHNARGVALDMLGRHMDARQSYAHALEASPDDPDVMNNLALSLAVGGEHAAALDILRGLDAREGENQAAVRENMALVVAMTGRPEDAVSLASTVMPPKTASGNRPFYDRLDELEGRALARAVFLGELPPGVRNVAESAPDISASVSANTDDQEADSPSPPERAESAPSLPKSDIEETASEAEAEVEAEAEAEAEAEESKEKQQQTSTLYHLQLGAFREHERLVRHWSTIAQFPGFTALSPLEATVTIEDGTRMYRLLAGPVEGYSAALRLCRSLSPEHACVVVPPVPGAAPLETGMEDG